MVNIENVFSSDGEHAMLMELLCKLNILHIDVHIRVVKYISQQRMDLVDIVRLEHTDGIYDP